MRAKRISGQGQLAASIDPVPQFSGRDIQHQFGIELEFGDETIAVDSSRAHRDRYVFEAIVYRIGFVDILQYFFATVPNQFARR